MLISLIDMAIVYFDINYNYTIFSNLSPLTLCIKSSLLWISSCLCDVSYVSAFLHVKPMNITYMCSCRKTSPYCLCSKVVALVGETEDRVNSCRVNTVAIQVTRFN